MTNFNEHMQRLLDLRANVDKAIQQEADRQGIDLDPAEVQQYSALVGQRTKGIGYVVLPHPDLQHAAAVLAAAAERWWILDAPRRARDEFQRDYLNRTPPA